MSYGLWLKSRSTREFSEEVELAREVVGKYHTRNLGYHRGEVTKWINRWGEARFEKRFIKCVLKTCGVDAEKISDVFSGHVTRKIRQRRR